LRVNQFNLRAVFIDLIAKRLVKDVLLMSR